MNEHLSIGQMVEVRGFKWPHRATATTMAEYLGEDAYGRWLGVAVGSAWRVADGSRSGVFTQPLVKLIPYEMFWSVCFHPIDPVVDVDIVLPVQWVGRIVEEVDLELDILKSSDGAVSVRDQDVFAQVRREWAMPDEVASEAEATCSYVRSLIEQGAEPFASVGQAWLARFRTSSDDIH